VKPQLRATYPSAAHGDRICRRTFIRTLGTLASASMLGLPLRAEATEPPPEITTIRLFDGPFLCFAPLYIAEDLLRLEGFREVIYLKGDSAPPTENSDIDIWGAPSILPHLDRGMPQIVLSGIHAGCWELFAQHRVRRIGDLKGRRVAVAKTNALEHVWLSSMFAYVGIDPRSDVQWVQTGSLKASQRAFLADEVDAFLAFPPQPQEMRLAKAGHVLLDTTFDKPWAQYFCCLVTGRRDFVNDHPIAAKRALRAMLKAADICATQPEQVARFLQKKGIEPRYEVSLDVLTRLPYHHWRDWNVADTLRFHALRLKDVGMIQSTPNDLIARCTDQRFLDALKREMKA